MSESLSFDTLLARLRSGDTSTIEAFVARYAPFVRRAVRARLTRFEMRGVADSEDICQSVLGSFLLRAAAGEYEIADAQALERLLAGIARNKFNELARRESAQKRGRHRVTRPEGYSRLPEDSKQDPARIVAARDLLDAVRARLGPDELPLFLARQAGRSWDEMAAGAGETAAALRQRLSRALRRISLELGLEHDDV
jgi:DNA-directed RNA polymerase specialized sigma24 family protein